MAQGPDFSPREMHALQLLKGTGAMLSDGHFVYTSGKHSDTYFNKDRVYAYPLVTQELSRMMAFGWRGDGIQTVIAPALGGIVLAHTIARELTLLAGSETHGVFAERVNRRFELTRGYADFVVGKRVLVADNILTTGGSVEEVVRLCRANGADVAGVAAIIKNPKIGSENVGNVSLKVLLNMPIDSWPEERCRLCQNGVPINTLVGKGREFLEQKGLKIP
jgi:orotate phosphoribosyltransferase